MSDITVTINTWACPNCEYKQYHDPSNVQQMQAIFPERRYAGRPDGACPACYAGENAQRTKQVSMLESINGADLSLLGQKTVASDATLESMLVPEFDERGLEVVEQTGERETLGIIDGKPAVVTEPVFEPKLRSLTGEEIAELKQQRDRNMDDLESVAVQEL